MENKIISMPITDETLNKIKTFYADYQDDNPNPYVVFFAKDKNLSITIYNSLMAVFMGKRAEEEALIFGYDPNPNWMFMDSHGGSDEVGTGDYFGPIVVCAAYVSKDQLSEINALGIKDSKKVSDQFIRDIVPKIIKDYPHSVLILDNKKYNQLVKEGHNMNSLKAILHNHALYHLSQKQKGIKYNVIDQFTPEGNYYKYVKGQQHIVRNTVFETKGESKSPAVALASLIARYSFLIYMDELNKQVGFELPLGAGEKVNEVIRKLLDDGKIDLLYSIAKTNFKNTEKAKEELQPTLL